MEKQIKLSWKQVWHLLGSCLAVEVDSTEVTYAQLWDADDPEHIQLEHFGQILQFVAVDNLFTQVEEHPTLREPVGPLYLNATDGREYELLLLGHMDLAEPLMELDA